MFVTIINDCNDQNAMNRQATRAASLFHCPVSTLGVSDFGHKGHGELEAAGNIIDTLDAALGEEGIIIVNVAIRHGKGKKWPNGTPFCYFFYKKTLILASIDGLVLSLVKKLQLVEDVQLMDIPTVIDAMIQKGLHKEEYRKLVVDSQFRSFEFLPRAAKWIKDGIDIPSTPYALTEILDAPDAVWFVDNFGNCVTTLFPEDIAHQPGKKLHTVFGEIPCYERLKDVPNGEPGLTIGSSGIENRRFVELVIQGKSAAGTYGITSGMSLFHTQ
jgi:hypothetical protein